MSPSTPSPSLYRTRIKICGLTREQDVDAAVAAGADAIGFVLYDKSPRHVSIERAREDYGVVLDPATLKLNQDETRMLRQGKIQMLDTGCSMLDKK